MNPSWWICGKGTAHNTILLPSVSVWFRRIHRFCSLMGAYKYVVESYPLDFNLVAFMGGMCLPLPSIFGSVFLSSHSVNLAARLFAGISFFLLVCLWPIGHNRSQTFFFESKVETTLRWNIDFKTGKDGPFWTFLLKNRVFPSTFLEQIQSHCPRQPLYTELDRSCCSVFATRRGRWGERRAKDDVCMLEEQEERESISAIKTEHIAIMNWRTTSTAGQWVPFKADVVSEVCKRRLSNLPARWQTAVTAVTGEYSQTTA